MSLLKPSHSIKPNLNQNPVNSVMTMDMGKTLALVFIGHILQ